MANYKKFGIAIWFEKFVSNFDTATSGYFSLYAKSAGLYHKDDADSEMRLVGSFDYYYQLINFAEIPRCIPWGHEITSIYIISNTIVPVPGLIIGTTLHGYDVCNEEIIDVTGKTLSIGKKFLNDVTLLYVEILPSWPVDLVVDMYIRTRNLAIPIP